MMVVQKTKTRDSASSETSPRAHRTMPFLSIYLWLISECDRLFKMLLLMLLESSSQSTAQHSRLRFVSPPSHLENLVPSLL